MRDTDWRSLVIYGPFTAIALLLLVVFARFINNSDGFVITSLLVLGAVHSLCIDHGSGDVKPKRSATSPKMRESPAWPGGAFNLLP